MGAKKKYARMNDVVTKYECTNKKCKWHGTIEQKQKVMIEPGVYENKCPKCANSEFYGLI